MTSRQTFLQALEEQRKDLMITLRYTKGHTPAVLHRVEMLLDEYNAVCELIYQTQLLQNTEETT